LPDKSRPVEKILEDPKLTVAGKFLMLLDQVPTCICGAPTVESCDRSAGARTQ
jgi:hypothetical protein